MYTIRNKFHFSPFIFPTLSNFSELWARTSYPDLPRNSRGRDSGLKPTPRFCSSRAVESAGCSRCNNRASSSRFHCKTSGKRRRKLAVRRGPPLPPLSLSPPFHAFVCVRARALSISTKNEKRDRSLQVFVPCWKKRKAKRRFRGREKVSDNLRRATCQNLHRYPPSRLIARNGGMVPRRTCVHCRPLRGHRSRFTCPPRKNRALRFLETGRSFFLASPPLSPDTVQWRYNVEWRGEPSQGHRRTMTTRSKPGDAADNETDR